MNITPITGGLLHDLWHVKSSQGDWVVKHLNLELSYYQSDPEICEHAASYFKWWGVHALTAFMFSNHFVQNIGDDKFLLYAYVDGKVLNSQSIDKTHRERIAETLALLHKGNFRHPDLQENNYCHLGRTAWQRLLKPLQLSRAQTNTILDACARYAECYNEIHVHRVLSHSDLHINNVVWSEDRQPWILDWEALRLVNPELELVATAFEWCNIFAVPHKLSHTEHFLNFIRNYYALRPGVYQRLAPALLLTAYLGEYILPWLAFNLEKLSNDPSTRIIIQEQLAIIHAVTSQQDALHELLVAASFQTKKSKN